MVKRAFLRAGAEPVGLLLLSAPLAQTVLGRVAGIVLDASGACCRE
jgi:hypothetical protein